jgi:hypothetical protein
MVFTRQAGTIPHAGTQLCALSATSAILFVIRQALGWGLRE